MNILALEFSSEQRSVAVLPTRGEGPSPAPVVAVEFGNTRIPNTFKLIERALGEAGLEREQIDCVAVGLGPGSYTGIRAAISVGQAWQLAREIKLLGISSVETLALQAQAAGAVGQVSFILDAQRNEFYMATYEIKPDGLTVLTPLRVATHAEVSARAAAGEKFLGPVAPAFSPEALALFPDAGALAKLSLEPQDFVSGEKLEPIYLRPTNFVKAPPPRFAR